MALQEALERHLVGTGPGPHRRQPEPRGPAVTHQRDALRYKMTKFGLMLSTAATERSRSVASGTSSTRSPCRKAMRPLRR